jgi:hypothetical protein
LHLAKFKTQISRILTNFSVQKTVATSIVAPEENTIFIKKCSEPNSKLQEMYQALKYKSRPFRPKKFVVPKPEHIKLKVENFKYFTG